MTQERNIALLSVFGLSAQKQDFPFAFSDTLNVVD
jgi:hypothetical protein